jgi:hypothetical protein
MEPDVYADGPCRKVDLTAGRKIMMYEGGAVPNGKTLVSDFMKIRSLVQCY